MEWNWKRLHSCIVGSVGLLEPDFIGTIRISQPVAFILTILLFQSPQNFMEVQY